ncbi:MAG: response regulator [Labilithrix sp.]|nr:response regulator [Labilithrix sp.]MCW5812504.1 response regulator [Labilithrix sp.]
MSARILVVDDTLQNRVLAEAQLEAAGYEVALAESGEEALAQFGRGGVALVLLDIMMPGIDGFETCKRLRRLEGGADVPILFLTASHDASMHDRAIDAGGDDFLRKPIDRTELLLRVRSLIRITRLQAELRKERDQLVRVQRHKDLLSALLVHDLKNPLSSVLANSQFVLENPTDEEATGALEDVISAAEAIHQMVLNLLDVGRAEDGALAPAIEEVDLHRLFEELDRYSRRRLATRQQRLELGREAAPRAIRADAALLSRTLQNLLDNSMKYSPPGSAIGLDVEVTPAALRFRVRDDGPGIPADQRARIFEKYAQVDGRAPDRASRGLGLVFCRLATEAHGGRIWVEENPPRGSAFVVELPSSPSLGGGNDAD